MYKLLLCLRYLRTRYLAFICIVSVMLGVATLIVVNSVMAGFSDKLKSHLNGLGSDLTIRTEAPAGFPLSTPDIEQQLKASTAGQYIEATSPTVETFALMQFTYRTPNGREIPFVKHVKVMAIDPARHAKVGKFGDYLVNSKDDPASCFRMTPAAKEWFDLLRGREARDADQRRQWEEFAPTPQPAVEPGKNIFGQPTPKVDGGDLPADLRNLKPQLPADPAADVPPPTIILGWDIAYAYPTDPKTGERYELQLLKPGDDVFLATVGSSGTRPVSASFVVTDYFRSRYGEIDANVVYVPLEDLQKLRGMDDRANCLQVRLTPDVRENPKFVHDTILPAAQAIMPRPESHAETWWQQQGSLLSAIEIERNLLNILLFLIIGVAGFGVLAIFSMIVSEKYRDIGVLKSLGASGSGVMGIFLGYGLLLGLVGGLLGTGLGVWITLNINDIEKWLAATTGRAIFDRKVYSFDSIPTHLDALSVALVNLGAVGIAVMSAVLPALRAARLQPVRALRFE